MIGLDFKDEDLVKAVNNCTSMLLPHENYNGSSFGNILNLVDRFIQVEEFSPEYRILFSTCRQLKEISLSCGDSNIKLTREVYSDLLESGITDFVVTNKSDLYEWFNERGIQVNLDIQESVELAVSALYESCMFTYDACFGLAIPSDTYVNHILALKSAFEQNSIRAMIANQIQIVQSSLRINRREYKGATGCREYVALTLSQIEERLDDSRHTEIAPVSLMEKSKFYREEGKRLSEPIMDYRIPPLDKTTPFFKHRLVVLVAKENVGKTVMAIDQVANCLVQGGKVLFMFGESVESSIYFKIASSYIRKKWGKFVTYKQVMDCSNTSDHAYRLIQMAESEILGQGKIKFIDDLTYSGVYGELENYYNEMNFDMVVIDHVGALTRSRIDSRRPIKECLDDMAIQLRNFKRKFPVGILALSHMGGEAEKQIDKSGKCTASPTRDSSVLPKEADEVFVITDSEEMNKKGIRALQIYKMRDASKITDLLYLNFQFNVYHMEFKNSEQSGQENSVEASAQEQMILETYAGDINGADEKFVFEDEEMDFGVNIDLE